MTSPECQHLFVRYRLGAFVCDECGECFKGIPSEMPPRKSDATIMSFLKSFIGGDITYKEALHGTGLDSVEFRACMQKAIPKKFITENCYTLGKEGGFPMVVGVEPHRTSDPELVDSFFSAKQNGFVGEVPANVLKLGRDQFPDIASLDVFVDHNSVVVCQIEFVDGTYQRAHLQ